MFKRSKKILLIVALNDFKKLFEDMQCIVISFIKFELEKRQHNEIVTFANRHLNICVCMCVYAFMSVCVFRFCV